MIAILFVDPDGAVEAFDIKGLTRMGRFGSVAEAAAFACADADAAAGISDEYPGKGRPVACRAILTTSQFGDGAGLLHRGHADRGAGAPGARRRSVTRC